MRNKLISTLLAFMFLINSTMGQNSISSNNYSQGQITNMLTKFYTRLAEICSGDFDLQKIDSLKKINCTKNYYKFLEKQEMLDYEPLIKGQDFGLEYLKKLTIRKDPQKNNLYHVAFIRTYDKSRVTIKLVIVKEGPLYKIDYVYLDN